MPTADPLLVRTADLSTVARAIQLLVPEETFTVLDAPHLTTDRSIRFQAAGQGLAVEVAVPLVSKPGPREPITMKGGVFDGSRGLDALDGLAWLDGKATTKVSRAPRGLKMEGPDLPRTVTIPAVHATPTPLLPPPASYDMDDIMSEVTLDEFVQTAAKHTGGEEAEAAGAKSGVPMLALALVTHLRPATVTRLAVGDVDLLIGSRDGIVIRLAIPKGAV